MNNYRMEYRSSIEPEMIGLLTDKNHLYTQRHVLVDIFKDLGFVNRTPYINIKADYTHHIDSWKCCCTKDDLCVIFKGNKLIAWAPRVEIKHLQEAISNKSTDITWGYIDGRASHLGFAATQGMMSSSMSSGYYIWIECKGKSGIFPKIINWIADKLNINNPYNKKS